MIGIGSTGGIFFQRSTVTLDIAKIGMTGHFLILDFGSLIGHGLFHSQSTTATKVFSTMLKRRLTPISTSVYSAS